MPLALRLNDLLGRTWGLDTKPDLLIAPQCGEPKQYGYAGPDERWHPESEEFLQSMFEVKPLVEKVAGKVRKRAEDSEESTSAGEVPPSYPTAAQQQEDQRNDSH